MAIRVLIDAHLIGSRETGNETYTVNLLHALSQLPDVECGAAILPGCKFPSYLSQVEPVTLSSTGNWDRICFSLPRLCRQWKADILHVNYIGPFYSYCPIVTTVHDVAFKRYPGFFSLRDRLLFATLLPLTMYHPGSTIITVSNHAKREIGHFYPKLVGKIHVTPEAADPKFRQVHSKNLLDNVKLRYGINSDFILAVGNLQPRKNLTRLIKAFVTIRDQCGGIQLVVVGKAQWQSSEIYKIVQHLHLENKVIFTGYVPDEDLVLLYNAARVYAYPSVYEGFGLPILEAMACGTPVITSNTASMPEVAGDAAVLVDPLSEEQIGQVIINVLRNPELATTLIEKGLKRAKEFSWQKTALGTLTTYQGTVGVRA